MTVTTHMCRGNFRSSWVAEGGYDFVADALFNQLEVDGFFMEWDDARSGGFEPLRFVPKGKYVVLGPGHHQERRARDPRGPRAPHRGGQPVRRPRPALPLAAVRLLLDLGGQRPHRGAAVGQAAPDRRDGEVGLGLTQRPGRQPSSLAPARRLAAGHRRRVEDAVPVGRADPEAAGVVLEVVAQVQLAQAPPDPAARDAVVQVPVHRVVDDVADQEARPTPPATPARRRPRGKPTRKIAASGIDALGGMTSRLGSFGCSWCTPWMSQCSLAPRPSSGSK